jgi:pimeloyl-ACP methyl ester carboxylesterase
VRANGIDLYYESYGKGQPLVLVSGLGYSLWQWHRMAPILAEQFQVLTFDNRGAGLSDKPPGPYSASLLAADTVGLLDRLGIERAAVMGHSMGGFVAQALALEYPARVARLILASTNFGGSRHAPITPEAMKVLADTSADAATRFKNGLAVSTAPGFADREPELVERWMAWRAANPVDPAAYQAQLAIGLGLLDEAAAFEKRLPAITAPTLILFGAHDAVVPPANADLLRRQIPNSEVCILPAAGHFFPLEIPAEAAQVVSEFVMRSSEV